MHPQSAIQDENRRDFSGLTRPNLQRISDCIPSGLIGDRLALVDSGGNWSYRQLEIATGQMESWLLYLGIRPGDRAMIVAENCRALIALIFALARIDASGVLVSAKLSPWEIDQIKMLCAPRRVFYTINVSPEAGMHATRHGTDIADDIDWGPVAFGPLNDRALPQIVVPEVSNRVVVEICFHDDSGETIVEKFTHQNLLRAAGACARISVVTCANVRYGSLPLYDALALSAILLPSLLAGRTVNLSSDSDRNSRVESNFHHNMNGLAEFDLAS